MSANAILIKKKIYFCNIFKIGKIGAIFSNFTVLGCKLNGHCRKIPDIFFNFFYRTCFPSPYLSRAVCLVNISHELWILEKFGTGYCTCLYIYSHFFMLLLPRYVSRCGRPKYNRSGSATLVIRLGSTIQIQVKIYQIHNTSI